MLFYESLTELSHNISIYSIEKKVIYSVYIQEIKSDDILSITSEFEVTNNHSYNAMIGSSVILTDCYQCVEGITLDLPNAYNVSPSMHHGVIIKARQFKSKNEYHDKFINVIAWSAADKSKNGDYLIIEKNYGHLDVFINN